MFTKIIVGIDGSAGGRDALALAGRLAAPDAEIVLVNAFPYEHRVHRSSLAGYKELLREDAQKILKDAAGGHPGYRVQAIPDTSPGRALHDQAEHERADLIVIGSCHRGAVGRVLLGDVSRSTLHGAPCPVAVAPHGYLDHPVAPIRTFGVGYNDTAEAAAALAFAAALAHTAGATLRVLTAVPTPSTTPTAYAYTAVDWTRNAAADRLAAEQRLAAAVKTLAVTAETEAIDEHPSLALEHLSAHVDIIVAGSRSWGAAHRVVLGSTTDRLTHRAHCPVIVVPGPALVGEPSAADRVRIAAPITTERVQAVMAADAGRPRQPAGNARGAH